MTSIYSKLESIYDSINDLIEEEEGTWYPDRKLPPNQLTDLEEVRDLLGHIINDEPTDQQMMASFGTKWHDGL
tara:strand:- start:225 stop:443 length:219 start_codon:yes stop_codon:yes gene_type:complete